MFPLDLAFEVAHTSNSLKFVVEILCLHPVQVTSIPTTVIRLLLLLSACKPQLHSTAGTHLHACNAGMQYTAHAPCRGELSDLIESLHLWISNVFGPLSSVSIGTHNYTTLLCLLSLAVCTVSTFYIAVLLHYSPLSPSLPLQKHEQFRERPTTIPAGVPNSADPKPQEKEDFNFPGSPLHGGSCCSFWCVWSSALCHTRGAQLCCRNQNSGEQSSSTTKHSMY